MMKSAQFYQIVLVCSTLVLSWLGMQAVHVLVQVLCAWAGGERVDRVVLHPLTISRTDASHDRHPLLVVWGGPFVGVILPLGALAFTRLIRSEGTYLLRFFAGFCLITNGVYLGVGSIDGVGDAGDLLRDLTPRWTLLAFGLICVPAGLALSHGLGPRFGRGQGPGRSAAVGTLGFLLVVVLIEVFVDLR